MLWRVQELFQGGGDLLRAEAQMAARSMRRAAISAAAVGLGVLIAVAGLGVVLAGVTVLIAAEAGWPAALLAVGAVVLLTGLVIAFIARSKYKSKRGEAMNPHIKAVEAKEQMRDAVDPTSPPPPQEQPGAEARHEPPPIEIPTNLTELKEAAVQCVTRHPLGVASGALLVLALVGPGRTLRMAARGFALASLVGSLMPKDERAAAGSRSGDDRNGPDTDDRPTPPPRPVDEYDEDDTDPSDAYRAQNPHIWKDPSPGRRNPMGIGIDRPPPPAYHNGATTVIK